jgi:hypothetical protein
MDSISLLSCGPKLLRTSSTSSSPNCSAGDGIRRPIRKEHYERSLSARRALALSILPLGTAGSAVDSSRAPSQRAHRHEFPKRAFAYVSYPPRPCKNVRAWRARARGTCWRFEFVRRGPLAALSHLAFLLLITYLTTGLGFNRFNGLGSR